MKLNLVIPCYNEELVLQDSVSKLIGYISEIRARRVVDDVDIVLVDDGSSDSTWEIIEHNNILHRNVHGLKLAHNVGHQNALWAGLEYCVGKCDCVISIDADLQHDITKIENMIDSYRLGYEVVFGVRNNRATDGVLKKITAISFYKLMSFMGVEIIPNHADFRLLGSKALQALSSYPERNIFLRGMVPMLGFKSTKVHFDVKERIAGESKYTLKKMLNLAFDGITSFSVKPLRLIIAAGVLCLFLALIEMLYVLIEYFRGGTIQGWPSIMLSVWFIGGFIILALGVVGEYIGKIYAEVKRRPRYIIEKSI